MRTKVPKQRFLFGPHRGALRYLLIKDANLAKDISRYFATEISELLSSHIEIDEEKITYLWQKAERCSEKITTPWLDIARLFQLSDLGELAWLMYYAEDFQTAFSSFLKHVLRSECELKNNATHTLFSIFLTRPKSPLMVLSLVSSFLVSLGALGVPLNLITEIQLPEWASPTDKHHIQPWADLAQKEFSIPLKFSGSILTVKFDNRIFSTRLRTADAAIHAFFRNRIEKSGTNKYNSKGTEASSELVVKLRQSIKAGLSASRVNAKSMAESVGVSVRTLERTLALQDLNLRSLKQQIQKETALELLRIGIRPKEVATQVGFSDLTTFSRAFTHWTGKTPSQIRKQRDDV